MWGLFHVSIILKTRTIRILLIVDLNLFSIFALRLVILSYDLSHVLILLITDLKHINILNDADCITLCYGFSLGHISIVLRTRTLRILLIIDQIRIKLVDAHIIITCHRQ